MPEGLAILVVIAVLVYGRRWIAPRMMGVSYHELREIKKEIAAEVAAQNEEVYRRFAQAEVSGAEPAYRALVVIVPDGRKALLRMWLLMGLPGGLPPRTLWGIGYDPTLDSNRDAYDLVVSQARFLIEKRLGTLWGGYSSETIAAPIPDLPGFPWDGSEPEGFDEDLVARFRIELAQRRHT